MLFWSVVVFVLGFLHVGVLVFSFLYVLGLFFMIGLLFVLSLLFVFSLFFVFGLFLFFVDVFLFDYRLGWRGRRRATTGG
jgi:hypothetical protein